VLEREQKLPALGTGVQIWINGAKGLDELGLTEAIRATSSPVQFHEFVSASGKPLARVPIGDLVERHGQPDAVTIRRPDLLRVLEDALDRDRIELGAKFTGFEQDGDGVSVELADGRTVRGAALVGADGLKSTVRPSLGHEREPRYAGYQYLRAYAELVPEGVAPGTMRLALGRGDRFGFSDLGGGWTYWFGIVVVPEGTTDSAAGRKADLRKAFGRFASPVAELIEATPEEAIGRVDTLDIAPLERWRAGRATLIGDAAHATTPNLGRGAGEAIDDAVSLARCLGENAAVEDALNAYERVRRPATAGIQTKARRIGGLMSARDPIRSTLLPTIFRRLAGPRLTKDADQELAAQASSPATPV
jgi:2-polyprenyl-6-methoxyphenol hydroxylase-like FAD-dependent oxidoreductase